MGSNCKTIVWFRRDLRIEDNPALAAAAREGSVLPVFIWCPKEEGQFYPGRVSRWWLKQSLIHLDKSLTSLGSSLVFILAQSTTLSALLDCITAVGATKVVYNHLYDPVSLVRDHNIKQSLGELGISVQSYNGDLLYEPWDVYNEDGNAFTTFEAYWGKCLNMEKEPSLHIPPGRLIAASGEIKSCSIEELGLEDELEKPSNALLRRGWSPGWSNADKTLASFIEHHLLDYSKNHLKVSNNSTSLLSPRLHFGELSVRKIFHSVRAKQILYTGEGNKVGQESISLFLRSLGLREYSRYICFNFPFTRERSLMSSLRFFPWRADVSLFKAWRQGRTGYPLVDAGMRELWATGWMHNRIRVIVASFFVKFLLLPWQWGMKYFWDTLLDADLETDILGWQYISGSMPDGHELERLDSPEVQGFKFDPQGDYVRQWLPELARMPAEWVHHPWDAPLPVLKAAGLELGLNYPNPIIDADMARDRLIEAIFIMRKAENSNTLTEVVFDNSESIDAMGIPKVVLRGKSVQEIVGCSSSRDQRVPSICKDGFPNKKRVIKCVEEDVRDCESNDGFAKIEDDLCSTAVSSSTKKRNTCTTSNTSFSVPRFSGSILNGEEFEEGEEEFNSTKEGAMETPTLSSNLGGSKVRQSAMSQEDDKLLCEAYFYYSGNPLTGTNQSGAVLWEKIIAKYNMERALGHPERSMSSLNNRFHLISVRVKLFSVKLTHAKNHLSGGRNEMDAYNEALEMFQMENDKSFTFGHCVSILMSNAKFNLQTTQYNTQQRRGSITSHADGSLNLGSNDEPMDVGFPTSQETVYSRPMDRDSAKKLVRKQSTKDMGIANKSEHLKRQE